MNELIYTFCLELALALFIYIIIMYAVWEVTENRHCIPQFLDFKPFNCRICASFWTLTTVFASSIYLGHLRFGIIGMLITVLSTVALKVDEHNRIKKGKELYDKIIK